VRSRPDRLGDDAERPVCGFAQRIKCPIEWGYVRDYRRGGPPRVFLVELFRGNSELAVALLRSCASIAVDHARLELGLIATSWSPHLDR
jgi:hypothetical protein